MNRMNRDKKFEFEATHRHLDITRIRLDRWLSDDGARCGCPMHTVNPSLVPPPIFPTAGHGNGQSFISDNIDLIDRRAN